MSDLSKNNKNEKCPISEDTRIWIENALIWLIEQFGEKRLVLGKLLFPLETDPPQKSEREKVAYELLEIVCPLMDVDPKEIILDLYDEGLFVSSGDMGFKIVSQRYEENYFRGVYHGKDADGKYHISLDLSQFHPNLIIATLAHEIAHIKILGEGRLVDNDEYLTDLVTVFFGLGIFNANAAFIFYSTNEGWGYSKQGYLKQQEWGYALALYAYIRRQKTPDWINYLTPNIKADFKKSEAYIYNNTDKVLV